MNLKKTAKTIMGISIKAIVYIAIVIIIYEIAIWSFGVGEKVFSESGYQEEPGKNISVTISSSMSKMEVAELLEDKGIVENRWIFYIQSVLYEADYEDGKYKLNTSYSPEDLVKRMSGRMTEGEEE